MVNTNYFRPFSSQNLDFVLDKSEIIDFELDIITSVDDSENILIPYNRKPDNVTAYGQFILTEDGFEIKTEDGTSLIY